MHRREAFHRQHGGNIERHRFDKVQRQALAIRIRPLIEIAVQRAIRIVDNLAVLGPSESGNRGGIVDTAIWPRVGVKSGFEAGVVSSAWVLERSDGRVFFATAGFNNSATVVPDSAPGTVLAPVFGCLATYQQPGDC